MSGFFDDDDNDNGVCLITSSLAALDPFALCGWTPFPVFRRRGGKSGSSLLAALLLR